jgi:hypothetical protein
MSGVPIVINYDIGDMFFPCDAACLAAREVEAAVGWTFFVLLFLFGIFWTVYNWWRYTHGQKVLCCCCGCDPNENTSKDATDDKDDPTPLINPPTVSGSVDSHFPHVRICVAP